MLHDIAARFLLDIEGRLSDLATNESAATDRHQPPHARRTARDVAERLRQRLLTDHPATTLRSALFRHLVASEQANADNLRDEWIRGPYRGLGLARHSDGPEQRESLQGLERWFETTITAPAQTALHRLPVGSFLIRFRFTLATPYLSRDDDELHITDNPVQKEQVFGFPMVPATGWKGALRAALRERHGWQERTGQQAATESLEILCGAAPEEADGRGGEGRLRCFPTFFKSGNTWMTGVEVISPHKRAAKTGTPIPIESVPVGANGDFTLLYVPFDQVGTANDTVVIDETNTRLVETTQAIETLFIELGFGAKTASGYGRAKHQTEGQGRVAVREPDGTVWAATFKSVQGLPRRAMERAGGALP